ncbi:MAG: hypothetical protein Q9208_000351 [Pyrenodesmia sp. 3 TL-2023]
MSKPYMSDRACQNRVDALTKACETSSSALLKQKLDEAKAELEKARAAQNAMVVPDTESEEFLAEKVQAWEAMYQRGGKPGQKAILDDFRARLSRVRGDQERLAEDLGPEQRQLKQEGSPATLADDDQVGHLKSIDCQVLICSSRIKPNVKTEAAVQSPPGVQELETVPSAVDRSTLADQSSHADEVDQASGPAVKVRLHDTLHIARATN